MNDRNWTPFINFAEYTSQNPDKPDVIDLQVADPVTFQTLYSTNVRVYQKDIDGNWSEKILPIKNHSSNNHSLFKQWSKAFHRGMITVNTHIRLKFYLDKSKRNADRLIRRFKLILLD